MKRLLVLLFVATSLFAQEGAQKFAALGDFPLESGETIRDCRIGYRTYGTLAADKSNVVVVLTWFGGTSGALAAWIGEGNLYDSSKYFVVAIDALGDGVSTSPSNSTAQPGDRFPQFSMRDLVRSQHALLTRELGLQHVYAVSGLSMGGMQTFQWLASFPDFMDKGVPIVGSPKPDAYDLLFWKTNLALINIPDARRLGGEYNDMHLTSPSWIAQHVSDVDHLMQGREKWMLESDPNNFSSQIRAMLALDIGKPDVIRARMFVVVSLQDETVSPRPARELARVTKSAILTLTSDCGHLATTCERDLLLREVHRFLDER